MHCVITSPPYWGLRDYGLEPIIWDGDKDCEHAWGKENVIRPVLYPPQTRIGGHCVSENFELLPKGRLKKVCKDLNEK